MENNLKREFKDFISILSTQICKEVLLDQLKELNKSFDATSKNYIKVGNDYSTTITGIKNQLLQLEAYNKELHEMTSNINQNNTVTNKSLKIIEGSHKEIIENIMKDNTRIFSEFNEKVQSLNEKERRLFISNLVQEMDVQGQKHLKAFRDMLDSGQLEKISLRMDSVFNEFGRVHSSMKDSEKNLSNNINNAKDLAEKKIQMAQLQTVEEINVLKKKITTTSLETGTKIDNLSLQLAKVKNMIIIMYVVGLITIILTVMT